MLTLKGQPKPSGTRGNNDCVPDGGSQLEPKYDPLNATFAYRIVATPGSIEWPLVLSVNASALQYSSPASNAKHIVPSPGDRTCKLGPSRHASPVLPYSRPASNCGNSAVQSGATSTGEGKPTLRGVGVVRGFLSAVFQWFKDSWRV